MSVMKFRVSDNATEGNNSDPKPEQETAPKPVPVPKPVPEAPTFEDPHQGSP